MSDQRLMHYLDLFPRLRDEELAQLAGAPRAQVAALREKVVQVRRALGPWRDLLEQLDDASLSRLTGASPHAVAFWRRTEGVGEPPVRPPLNGGRSASTSGPTRGGSAAPRAVPNVDTQPLELAGTGRATQGINGYRAPAGAASADDDDDDLVVVVDDEPEGRSAPVQGKGEDEEIDFSGL